MSSVPIKDPIIWADVETDGTEDDSRLLEVGFIVTDGNLTEIDYFKSLVDPGIDVGAVIGGCDPFVVEMHTKSGLWADLQYAKSMKVCPKVDDVQRATLYWLNHIGMQPGTAPLGGSSIHFDRRLFRRDMPELDRFAHYRSIDVSTIKELARRWAPTIYELRPGKEEADKKHRVLDDIRGSLEELKHYRERFLHEELVR